MRDQYEHWLQILMMVSAFVLLIVCANVANLMLVRGLERRRQISLSMALGAPAARLMRQVLTESILLSLAGGAAGLVVWLKASPATVQHRATGAAHRAWLETGGPAWIRDAITQRDPLYASVADLTLEVDRRSSKQVARDVLAWLRGIAACRAFVPEPERR